MSAEKTDAVFVRHIESKVRKTISDFGLIRQEDKVLVAVSGGKDSTTALYLLKKLGYDVEGIMIDQLLGEYSRQNLTNIQDFCGKQSVKLHIIRMSEEYGCSVCYMKSVLDSKGIVLNTCTICGVIRRNLLNKKAKALKATKIVTGHNLDDELQSFVMNMIQGNIAQSARLGPKSGIGEDTRFVQRVKPLYFCMESETERYSRIKGFPVVYEKCPCSLDSYRTHVKKMLNELEKEFPQTKEKMLRNFLKNVPDLKLNFQGKKAVECSKCGEPSSQKTCRTCVILNNLGK